MTATGEPFLDASLLYLIQRVVSIAWVRPETIQNSFDLDWSKRKSPSDWWWRQIYLVLSPGAGTDRMEWTSLRIISKHPLSYPKNLVKNGIVTSVILSLERRGLYARTRSDIKSRVGWIFMLERREKMWWYIASSCANRVSSAARGDAPKTISSLLAGRYWRESMNLITVEAYITVLKL